MLSSSSLVRSFSFVFLLLLFYSPLEVRTQPVMIDDTQIDIIEYSGNWSHDNPTTFHEAWLSNAHERTLSSTSGGSLKFQFYGSNIVIYAFKWDGAGTINLSINGAQSTVDLLSTNISHPQIVYSSPQLDSNTPSTLSLTAAQGAQGAAINFDYFSINDYKPAHPSSQPTSTFAPSSSATQTSVGTTPGITFSSSQMSGNPSETTDNHQANAVTKGGSGESGSFTASPPQLGPSTAHNSEPSSSAPKQGLVPQKSSSPDSPESSNDLSDGHSLNGRAIAGIVMGILMSLILAIVAWHYVRVCRRRRRIRQILRNSFILDPSPLPLNSSVSSRIGDGMWETFTQTSLSSLIARPGRTPPPPPPPPPGMRDMAAVKRNTVVRWLEDNWSSTQEGSELSEDDKRSCISGSSHRFRQDSDLLACN